ncbi:MAG: glycosyltransferase family 2 protein [Candidatus Protochlamydia sp.]|nr:glycosyltransferase family 2 protein [Candidatus Protochlamydia sp.]
MQNSLPTIGVLIPTFQGAGHLPKCLPPLLESPLKPRVLVIDSSSSDGTASLAQSMGAEIVIIPQIEFNHGLTREKGRRLLGTDIVVMVSQDAYAASPHTLNKLVRPLVNQEASIAYARQLPHDGAGFFASFPRQFNYPATSHIRSLKDRDKFGLYTFFCSNSCAAYLNTALDQIGGFQNVLFGEDTVAVAQLLRLQHSIAYVAEAEVHHSHDYTLKQEFSRHFDIGLARSSYQHLFDTAEKDTKRGKAYMKALFSTIAIEHPLMLPYAVLQTACKFAGYQLGRKSEKASLRFKKFFSSQKFYWK